jgi:hypothetical protein
MSDPDLDDLRAELDDFAEPEKKGGRSAREERIIAGFEEIQRFVEKNGRAPQHGEDRDIFERLYAVRLDRLRALEECRSLLTPLDHQGLLTAGVSAASAPVDSMDDDELLAELGEAAGSSDITSLTHVRATADRRAAEEIANRQKCEDFEQFKPLFHQIQRELDSGVREARRFQKDAEIKLGELFILGGQKVYVAEFGEEFLTEQGRRNARLRLIFDNGTESRGLLRSFQRALYKDEAGRRITEPTVGPLFDEPKSAEGDESGTIYVLRSKSDHPLIAAHRNVIHKIGVTGGDVETRIANAKLDATFLLADVEVVATYTLHQINRSRLENLLHRVFGSARLELEIGDRFGITVKPREWFLAPLPVIDEVVRRIQDGSIVDYEYDRQTASLRKVTHVV